MILATISGAVLSILTADRSCQSKRKEVKIWVHW
jgi:hypothetical protein